MPPDCPTDALREVDTVCRLGGDEFVREQGCDEVQGYWHSWPLSVAAFKAFVQQRAIRP